MPTHIMQVLPIRTGSFLPPQDSLVDVLEKVALKLKPRDIVAISSKVVSIDEGRCVSVQDNTKEDLIYKEADWYYRAPKSAKYRHLFTISGGALVGSAGIDESNGNGYFILYPRDPMQSAYKWKRFLEKKSGVSPLGVIVTDSMSIPLRRGTLGFALGWSGFEPLKDYIGKRDLFGRPFQFEVANLADSLATAATLEMGEGDERTPIVILRNAPRISFNSKKQTLYKLAVTLEEDLFAPILRGRVWKPKKIRRSRKLR